MTAIPVSGCGAILMLLLAPALAAQTTITFPLEGHFRPGRYLPVHIVADHAVTLSADGAVQLQVSSSVGKVDLVAPWLVVTPVLSSVHWNDGQNSAFDLEFRPLAETEQFVGLAGVTAADAQSLWPDRSVVSVHPDLNLVVHSPAAAWQALDAICLDEFSAGQCSEKELQELLSANVAVAIKSSRKPSSSWPWRRRGGFWLVEHPLSGPRDLVEPAAYGPTYSWARGRSELYRRRTILVAAIFSFAMLAVAAWRSKHQIPLAGLLVAGFSVGWFVVSPASSLSAQLSGDVFIQSQSVCQTDRWTWLSPFTAAEVTIDAAEFPRPVFASQRQFQDSRIRLETQDAGVSFQFHARLPAFGAVAFVQQSVRLGQSPAVAAAATTSLARLAEDLYLRPGARINGQASDTGDENVLPPVLLQDDSSEVAR